MFPSQWRNFRASWSARGTSSLTLPQGPEIEDVEDAAVAILAWLPRRLHPHPDANLVLRHLPEVVHHPHLRRSAVQAHDADENRIHDPFRVRVEIGDREGLDRPRVSDVRPFIGRTEALLAEHPGRKEDSFARVAGPSN